MRRRIHDSLQMLAPVVGGLLTMMLCAAAASQRTPPLRVKPRLDRARLVGISAVNNDGTITVTDGQKSSRYGLAGVAFAGSDAGSEAKPPAITLVFMRNLLVGERFWLLPAGSDTSATEACRKVWLYRWPDGLFVNLEMVRQGYAACDVRSSGPNAAVLSFWSDRARSLKKGIWSEPAGRKHAVTTQPAGRQQAVNGRDRDPIVYITRTGRAYHRDGCPALRSSRIAIRLSEAKEKGYRPCRRCKPPQ